MTELYYPDNEYRKQFDSKVEDVEGSKGYVVLEDTLFYKEGGGQPSDQGTIEWSDSETEVLDVQKEHGEIRHYVEGELPEPGTEVHGEIDWERRYKHMKMHTAQHVLSWVVLNMYGASTAGNQIHEEYSRIDFEPVEFSDDDVDRIEKSVNKLIERDLEVEKSHMDRERLEERVDEGRTNLDIIPDGIDPLRAVEIGGEDLCPCGGTHVDSLGEIGGMNITDRMSKGSEKERLRFELES